MSVKFFKLFKHFWPTCAIVLGVWESASFFTPIPSITETARVARKKHFMAKLVILVWLWGLGRHLLLSEKKIEEQRLLASRIKVW